MDKTENDILLSVDNLKTHFFTDDGVATAVDGVSYDIPRGKTLALVGESGCGKSVSALSIMRLIPSPPGRIVDGKILFEGKNLLDLSESQMRNIRGNDISMIFQEPMTSLNPVFTVGNQVIEAVELHQGVTGEKAREMTVEMFRKVGIADPEQRVDEYPHQMSGGMRQRVMIAMALVCNPKLLIADEPTTALDVTIQAQILELLRSLQKDFGMSILLITHNLGVVAEMADHVAVMYASKIVEYAEVNELFENPLHPYTIGLFKSLPKLGRRQGKLNVIEGTVPNPIAFPDGCHFWPRCPRKDERSMKEEPPLVEKRPGHKVACWAV
ncbi:MAG: ABC transporter ATP-binding protein [Planctomycetota bacterium]